MAILRRFCPEAEERKLHALAFSVIGQCLHYKMARSIAERLVGPDGMAALDLDYLTEHITTFCLAALGCVPPLDAAGESAVDGVAAAS
jgi:TetR/AcrR family transcriptional regulator, regulator of cefoperazone and chloramphenicol sensitivity